MSVSDATFRFPISISVDAIVKPALSARNGMRLGPKCTYDGV